MERASLSIRIVLVRIPGHDEDVAELAQRQRVRLVLLRARATPLARFPARTSTCTYFPVLHEQARATVERRRRNQHVTHSIKTRANGVGGKATNTARDRSRRVFSQISDFLIFVQQVQQYSQIRRALAPRPVKAPKPEIREISTLVMSTDEARADPAATIPPSIGSGEVIAAKREQESAKSSKKLPFLLAKRFKLRVVTLESTSK